jgi:hypothetical protein
LFVVAGISVGCYLEEGVSIAGAENLEMLTKAMLARIKNNRSLTSRKHLRA